METAVLGGGCFWCLEAVYREVPGVAEVLSGYCGGTVANPNYRDVCTDTTGHAEVVQLRFDPAVVSYRRLLEIFFTIHDPTTRDRQGHDIGSQYRSAIFTQNAEQERIARQVMAEMAPLFPAPLVTELAGTETFYPAEAEHHDYYHRHPTQPYCRAVIEPKLAKYRKMPADG